MWGQLVQAQPEQWAEIASPLLRSYPILSEGTLASMVFSGREGGPHQMRIRLKDGEWMNFELPSESAEEHCIESHLSGRQQMESPKD